MSSQVIPNTEAAILGRLLQARDGGICSRLTLTQTTQNV